MYLLFSATLFRPLKVKFEWEMCLSVFCRTCYSRVPKLTLYKQSEDIFGWSSSKDCYRVKTCLRFRSGLVRGLVGRVNVGVRPWGMHYTHESPHKHRNRRVCVLQWWLFPLSSLLPCCFLTNGPMRKAQLVLITFCSATKHHLTFVHKRCTGTLSSRKMLAICSPHFWRLDETSTCIADVSAHIYVH